jgi:NADPH2:quinone reductase
VPVSAARLVEHGAALRIEEVTLADPGPDEVLVDMAYGSVNPVDRYAALGLVASNGPVPRTLGGEGAGTVDGKPVIVHGAGVGSARDGVWATAAVVPRAAITEVPDGVDLEKAATAGVAGATAWRTVELAGIGPKDRVLVLGASGGVGSMIVSFAHSLGATVWGQTERGSNSDWIRGLGADEVVVCGSEDLAKRSAALSATVVLDPLGDGFTAAGIELLEPGGTLVLFGTSAGSTGELPLQTLYRNSLRIIGYGGLSATHESLVEAKRGALKAIAEGQMTASIGATFGLADVNKAFDLLVKRKVQGKILLDMKP